MSKPILPAQLNRPLPLELFTLSEVKTLSEGEEQEPKMVIGGLGAVYYDGTPGTEYEYWDGVMMRLKPGCLDEAVREDDVRTFFNHDANWLLGRTKSGTMKLSMDARGVRYETTLSNEDPQAKSAFSKVSRGDCDGSSILFDVVEELWEKLEDGTYVNWLTKIRPLKEMGPVVFPAMRAANSAALSEGTRRELQHRLDAHINALAQRQARERLRLRMKL